MNFVGPALWSFVVVTGLVVALRIWNYFARRYNDAFLAGTSCSACGARLGHECIPTSRMKWREEVRVRRSEGRTGIWKSNLEL